MIDLPAHIPTLVIFADAKQPAKGDVILAGFQGGEIGYFKNAAHSLASIGGGSSLSLERV